MLVDETSKTIVVPFILKPLDESHNIFWDFQVVKYSGNPEIFTTLLLRIDTSVAANPSVFTLSFKGETILLHCH